MEQKYAATYKFGKTTVHVVAPPPMTEEEKEKRLHELLLDKHKTCGSWLAGDRANTVLPLSQRIEAPRQPPLGKLLHHKIDERPGLARQQFVFGVVDRNVAIIDVPVRQYALQCASLQIPHGKRHADQRDPQPDDRHRRDRDPGHAEDLIVLCLRVDPALVDVLGDVDRAREQESDVQPN